MPILGESKVDANQTEPKRRNAYTRLNDVVKSATVSVNIHLIPIDVA